jgi:sec-independent protein translocase protein TatC
MSTQKKSDKKPADDKEETETPLMAHLVELRGRLVACVGVLLVAFAVSYAFARDIYGFLVEPLAKALAAQGETGSHRLIYTQLTEVFFTYLGVALWTAFFVTSPFILIQIWRFLKPGLYFNERGIMLPYIILTPVLFFAGAAAAYYFVFPTAWHFFLSFETGAGVSGLPIQLEARVSDYLSLSMALILAFGFAFEVPLGLVLLVHLGVLTTAQLKAFRRYAIVANFILAAVITPPDVFSQLALAVPLCLFYEIAVFVAGVVEKSRTARLAREEKLQDS